eukprot:CAMPEP_0179081144 /NCGR_PEP_ID=MMETSP0796-20121207/36516_1 /TAXON_ID=73915 /ORGANISM="Pyrodinium bahamense, Strain pbaha01" /LENGTH=370 /DNA_ID=CAMNT_0020778521 /DNA_START=234 /DNA_END=1346 /DNA_ORIENTATION=+
MTVLHTRLGSPQAPSTQVLAARDDTATPLDKYTFAAMPGLPEHLPCPAGGTATRRRKVATSVQPTESSAHQVQIDAREVPHSAPKRFLDGADALLVNGAAEKLRAVLQSMNVDQRRVALESLPLQVRAALLAFMKSAREVPTPALRPAHPGAAVREARSSMAGDANVRAIENVHGTAYQAQMRIGHLRVYTPAQPRLEAAMEHQEVLEHLREWIDRSRVITTPVLKLADALAVHSRLLRARQTSWASLRAEWASLLCRTRLARKRGLSLAEAEATAERARRGLLERQLRQAARALERALVRKQRSTTTALKKCERAHRKAVKGLATQAAQERVAAKHRQQLRDARWRWLCRADLTTAEMLRGPPEHLAKA